jgi:ferredoxin
MYIISSECIQCGACSAVCPVEAISQGDTQYMIGDTCVDCGSCAEVCPVGAISPG